MPSSFHNTIPVILTLFKESLKYVSVSFMKYEAVRTCGDIACDTYLIGYQYFKSQAILNNTNHREIYRGKDLTEYLSKDKVDAFICINVWTQNANKLLHKHLPHKSLYELMDM
jgi:hypothetical protein